MPLDKKNLNPLLTWLWDLLSAYSVEEIRIPTTYHDQVDEIKEILSSDTSGLVNSVLDFAINASAVDFTIEADTENFSDVVSYWFKNINLPLVGKVPVGIKALSREYYRERWKNSSLLLLRTIWENVKIGNATYNLPTKMWFIDGANIHVEDKSKSRIIGNESYSIIIDPRTKRSLPAEKNELIFIQKPYSSWSELYPTPFMVQRGLLKNLKFYNLLNKKSEKIIGKALEYLLLLKKGTENLVLNGTADTTYSQEDLTKIKDEFKTLVKDSKSEAGVPTYVTNFDTQMEHFIPDYAKALSTPMYAPIEKRLLAGLGLIEIVDGVSSSRREGILNPRPFIREVENGINDFISLLSDVVIEIKRRNEVSHPKYINENIQLHYTPVSDFITDNVRDHLRSLYDRGILSKRTYGEVVGQIDIDVEVTRRKKEKSEVDEVMYPPVITNQEATPDATSDAPIMKENVPGDKKGIESKNYKGSYEEAPWKDNKSLPEAIKKYPSGAQTAFREAFNNALKTYKNEASAFKVAWSVLKKYMKKHHKEQANELSTATEMLAQLKAIREIELIDAKEALIKKLSVTDENKEEKSE